MMFFSFARNNSSAPLSCGLTFGFIASPKNKIARFWRCACQNLAISRREIQMNSLSTTYRCHFLTADFESEEVTLQKLRERLRLMTDEELIKFGKQVVR